MRVTALSTLLLASGVLAGCGQDVPTASEDLAAPAFAHESNNRADLSGTQDGTAIAGMAIVNYAKGAPREWRSTVNLKGELDPGTYTFYVSLNGTNQTAVCTFTVDENGGRQGCSADTDLPGFNMATVREGNMVAAGDVVASGTFDRRGGQRGG